jgi:hypothetical protein
MKLKENFEILKKEERMDTTRKEQVSEAECFYLIELIVKSPKKSNNDKLNEIDAIIARIKAKRKREKLEEEGEDEEEEEEESSSHSSSSSSSSEKVKTKTLPKERVCRYCEREYLIEDFIVKKTNAKSGISTVKRCKQCRREQTQAIKKRRKENNTSTSLL